MACSCPLDGWVQREKTKHGKRGVTFRSSEGWRDLYMSVPCGKCTGCLVERSRQWAVRAVHEASLWRENSFVTLTYSEDKLPMLNGVPSLRPKDFVLFMKRLRKWHFESAVLAEGEVYKGVRFLHAGEYGRLGRPHHHAILFNCGFGDRVAFRVVKGRMLYRSATLEKLWPDGFSTVGEVTHESAAYVAGYTLKKFAEVGSDAAPGAGGGVRASGQVAEYLTMSRGGRKAGGLGIGWFEKFGREVFPFDEVVRRNGRRDRPPRFYDERLRKQDVVMYDQVKARRIAAAVVAEVKDPGQWWRERLSVKGELAKRLLAERLKKEV